MKDLLFGHKPAAKAVNCGIRTTLMLVVFAASIIAGRYAPAADESDLGETQDSITVSISDLGADGYERRRSAFIEIWRQGLPALEAVKEATQSSDLQIAQSAKVLEKLLIMDVSSEEFSLSDFQTLMNPSITGITDLCQRGRWRLAAHLLETDTEFLAQLRDPQNAGGTFYLNRMAEFALEQGDVQLVWPIIRLVTGPLSSTYDGSSLNVWLAEKLRLELAPDVESEVDVRAQRLFFRGSSKQALDLEISEPLRRKLLTRGGRWSEVLQDKNLATILGRRDTFAGRAAEAVLLEFGGNLPAAKTVWTELLLGLQDEDDVTDASARQRALEIASRIQQARPAQQSNRLILAMILAGHVGPVEQYFLLYQPDAAFRFFVAGNDHANALAAIKLDPDLGNFDSWLRRREIKITGDLSQNDTDSFSQSVQVCSLLTGLGFKSEASRVLDMLVDVSDWKENLWTGSGYLISRLGRSEQRELCLQAVEDHINKMPRNMQLAVLASLYPEFRSVVGNLASKAPVISNADGTSVSLIRKLEKLHAWDVAYFNEQVGPNAVVDWLVRTERALISEQLAISSPALFIAQIQELARLAAGCGFPELAIQIADVDTRDFGSPERTLQIQWIDAARFYLAQGDTVQAAQRLGQLRQSPQSPNNQAALVSEVKALILDGRYDAAVQLDCSRWLRPLSVSRFYRGASYAQVVDELVEQGDFPNAKDYAELAFMLSDFASLDVFWSASDLADILTQNGDYPASANVLRASLAEALGEDSTILMYFGRRQSFDLLRYSAQKERLHQAVASIMRQDFTAAKRHMEVAARLQPQDIELVVQCYPRLVELGQQQLADDLFEQFEAAMKAQIATWPKDATALNNLAWMYAKCDRQLDAALPMSQQAVGLAPTSAVYLDTLAEVYFRLGDARRALELMQQCVRLDPRDANYRKNLKRFSAALE